MREQLPGGQRAEHDGRAQQRHGAHQRRGLACVDQSTGLSHRSAFSNAMKNITLTRMTKQIDA